MQIGVQQLQELVVVFYQSSQTDVRRLEIDDNDLTQQRRQERPMIARFHAGASLILVNGEVDRSRAERIEIVHVDKGSGLSKLP